MIQKKKKVPTPAIEEIAPTTQETTKAFDAYTPIFDGKILSGAKYAFSRDAGLVGIQEDLWRAMPNGQPEETPAEKRMSVLTGRTELSPGEKWKYINPYWVIDSEVPSLEGRFVVDNLDGLLIHISKAERMYSGGYSTQVNLVKRGFIKCNVPTYRPSNCTWEHQSKVVKFIGENGKPDFAPRGAISEFSICGLTGERYSRKLTMTVIINEDRHRIFYNPMTAHLLGDNVQDCHNCGHAHVRHLLKVDPEISQQLQCKRCINKFYESKVVRTHDDSNFLPAMYAPRNAWRMIGGVIAKISKPNLRLYGVELEVGFNVGERAETALDAWDTIGRDFCYIKHDGSIINAKKHDGSINVGAMKMGFEIVSAPANLDIHRERWKKLSKMKYFKNLRSWDTKVCGFHVHVSKDALTQVQIGRILVFVNHPCNRYFIEVVAGRGSNCYTQYHQKNITDSLAIDDNKYTAIRTNKKYTIEFRIFRGTINYKHIIRNMEFCDALCDYCAPCEVSIRDLADFRNFIKWVAERRQFYPILADWLATIDLVAKKPLAKNAVIDIDTEAHNPEVAKQLALMTEISKSGESIENAIKQGKAKLAKPASKKAFDSPFICEDPSDLDDTF